MSDTTRRGLLATLLAAAGLTVATTPPAQAAEDNDTIDGGTP